MTFLFFDFVQDAVQFRSHDSCKFTGHCIPDLLILAREIPAKDHIFRECLDSGCFSIGQPSGTTFLTELPKVGIVYGYANCSPLPMEAFVNAKFDGIVLAGVGDGNFYKDVFDEALKARQKGILVVRSSRVPTGPTCLNGEVDDTKYQFVASLALNPQKARVLLMLALTKTHDWQKIQEYFQKY